MERPLLRAEKMTGVRLLLREEEESVKKRRKVNVKEERPLLKAREMKE